MRGCGTVFNDDPGEREQEELVRKDLQRIADRLRWRADQIDIAITHCRNKNSNIGLFEMVAFAFNANQYTPSFGGGGEQLPPGKGYKVVAVETGKEDAASGNGGFVYAKIAAVEGPLAGKTQMMRFNLHHTNAKTVEIANEQFSALCHVTGVIIMQDLDQLLNRPFMVDIDWQKGHEPGGAKGGESGGYTEVKALCDMNGQKPGKGGGAGANAQPQQQPPQQGFTPPPAGVQAQGGWTDPNAGQAQGQPMQQQQQQQHQPQQGWAGAPPQGQPMQQHQPQQQQPQQGWGGNAAPPQQGGGWGNS